jgi:hypothetical protein
MPALLLRVADAFRKPVTRPMSPVLKSLLRPDQPILDDQRRGSQGTQGRDAILQAAAGRKIVMTSGGFLLLGTNSQHDQISLNEM